MRTNQPGHLTSFDYRGLYRYFLTFCTDYRQQFFVDAANVEIVLSQFLRAASENHLSVLAYCFMPDHLHLLVEGQTDDADCWEFIRKAKQYSGFYFSKARGQNLWQRYGFERVLRDDEATLDVARYILNNPLRAGLVRDVRDYPYVGSATYSLEEMLEAAGDVRAT